MSASLRRENAPYCGSGPEQAESTTQYSLHIETLMLGLVSPHPRCMKMLAGPGAAGVAGCLRVI